MFLHGQSAVTLEAAHALLQTLTSDRRFSDAMDSTQLLTETLEDTGFSGLWRACSLGLSDDLHYNSFTLTEKVIEVCFHCPGELFFFLGRESCHANMWKQLIII